MNRAIEAVAIALVFAYLVGAASRYVVVWRRGHEYALASACRASAYYLLTSNSTSVLEDRLSSIPEARVGLGEYSVAILVPNSTSYEVVVVEFEP
ncbi:MAG: hypothetical protein DRK00_11240 [Thermoprotei archaeon]|nr:MAG: hypothetical protein DRK00_11240 [Thermoprotei archaeon]